MKKTGWILVGTLLLTGCKWVGFSENSEFDTAIDADFDRQIETMKSRKGRDSFEAYAKAEACLDEQYKKIDDLMKNETTYKVSLSDYDGIVKETSTVYWKHHDRLMIELKEVLQDAENYAVYDESIDAEYYANLDLDRLFHSMEYRNPDASAMQEKIDALMKALQEETLSFEEWKTSFLDFYEAYHDLTSSYGLVSLYQDLYAGDADYRKDGAAIGANYDSFQRQYRTLLKAVLESSYREAFAEAFSLTSADIESILSVEEDPEEVIALKEKEEQLVDRFSYHYNLSDSSFDYENNFLELVRVRREIAEKLNDSDYLEVVWEDTYGRDYSIAQANALIENVLSSSRLSKLYFSYGLQGSLAYIGLRKTKINESDLFTVLNRTAAIFPEAEDAVRELRTYGNYNFDLRSDKYSGSYVSNFRDEDYFVFVSGEGNYMMLPSAVHEFGHYLGLTRYDLSLSTGSENLDICEVHSQGLEYLMINEYANLIGKSYASDLMQYQMSNALWTLLSGSAVAAFENYVYTCPEEELTVSNLRERFSEYIRPLNGVSFSFTEVPHIYLQPGYYVSYVTSIMPSLELYSLDYEEAKNAYRTLIRYGEGNGFEFVLEQAGLPSPFEEATLTSVIEKLESGI